MLFWFLRTLLGPLLHLWRASQYLLSLFHFLELVVNLNRVIKVKDHPQKVETTHTFTMGGPFGRPRITVFVQQ